ncbi:hypothetical protein [Oceanihabitans sp. IOP_32]|nr:hypothetical protein [Oceanihabitans sp. IOP_32]
MLTILSGKSKILRTAEAFAQVFGEINKVELQILNKIERLLKK